MSRQEADATPTSPRSTSSSSSPSTATYYEAAGRPRERQGRARPRLRRQAVPRLLRRHPHRQRRATRNEKVNAAVRAQMDRLGHVSTLYPTLPIVELAEKLVKLAPGQARRRPSSAPAAPRPTRRPSPSRRRTPGGRSSSPSATATRGGACSRSRSRRTRSTASSRRRSPAIKHAHAPYCYRCPFGLKYPSCDVQCAKDVEELIQTTTTGQIAGFHRGADPGRGRLHHAAGGLDEDRSSTSSASTAASSSPTRCRPASAAPAARCGASSTTASQPDMMTMAKGIANGYPISAVLTTRAIADSWKGGNISTFGGNPITADRRQRDHRRHRGREAGRERRGHGQAPARRARGA